MLRKAKEAQATLNSKEGRTIENNKREQYFLQ